MAVINMTPHRPVAKSMEGWFDPFKAETEALAVRDDLLAHARELRSRMSEFTHEGLEAQWERDTKPYAVRITALKASVSEGLAGLERVEQVALSKLVPEVGAKDAATRSADEAQYQRLSARIKRIGADKWVNAAQILADNAGTTFARLWVDEMTAEGVFTPEGSHTVSEALKYGHEPFRDTMNFIQYGRTVINAALYPLIKDVDRAAGLENVIDPATAPGYVDLLTEANGGSAVGVIVCPPFSWKLDGTAVSHGEEIDARRAAQKARNQILREQLAESEGTSAPQFVGVAHPDTEPEDEPDTESGAESDTEVSTNGTD